MFQYKHKLDVQQNQREFWPAISKMITGAISGSVARTCTNSFERIKILKQCRIASYHGLSMAKSFRLLLSTEGSKGLFKGNLVNVLRVAPFTAFEFYFYDLYKRLIMGQRQFKHQYLFHCLCGGLTGITCTTLTYPMDVIRTYLSVENLYKPRISITNSHWNSIKSVFKYNGGLLGFYKGYFISIMGIIPYVAMKMSSFDFFKQLRVVKNNKNGLIYLFFGGISGAIACTVTYPFDLLRRRFQIKEAFANVPTRGNLFETIKYIYTTYGVKGFYRGLPATYWKVVPSVGIICMSNELLKRGIFLDYSLKLETKISKYGDQISK